MIEITFWTLRFCDRYNVYNNAYNETIYSAMLCINYFYNYQVFATILHTILGVHIILSLIQYSIATPINPQIVNSCFYCPMNQICRMVVIENVTSLELTLSLHFGTPRLNHLTQDTYVYNNLHRCAWGGY